MKTTTIAVYTNRGKAEGAIMDLNDAGVNNDEISCIYTNAEGELKNSRAIDKMESSAATGTATGAAVGLVAGLVLANSIIPGIGSVLVAGTLAELLGITAITSTVIVGVIGGAVIGGIVGALTKIGVTDSDAIIYEAHLKSGNILVVTRTSSQEPKNILIRHGGIDVHEYMSA